MADYLKNDSKDIQILLDAILSFEKRDELLEFFDDLLTLRELEEFGHRFAVARMLEQGKIYTDIQKSTGASSATISRVNRALTYGANGYKKAIKRLQHK